MQPAVDERQQPAFVLRNERIPGVGFAGADLLDQQGIGVRSLRHDVRKSGPVQLSSKGQFVPIAS
jgi:hypothetical protein